MDRYKQLFDTSHDGILLTDMQGHIFDANKAYCDMIGYTLEELKKMTYQELTPEIWHEYEKHIVIDNVIEKGYSEPYDKEYMRKDGKIIPVNLRVWLVKNEVDKAIGMCGIFRDMSYQKLQKDVVGNGLSKTYSYFYSAPTLMVVINRDEQVIDINKRAAEVLKCTREEAIGENWFDKFVSEEYRECVRGVFHELISTGIESPEITRYENPIITCCGEERIITWYNSAIRDEHDRIIATISTGEDITDIIKIAEELVENNEVFDSLKVNLEKADRIIGEVKKSNGKGK